MVAGACDFVSAVAPRRPHASFFLVRRNVADDGVTHLKRQIFSFRLALARQATAGTAPLPEQAGNGRNPYKRS
jgi:hypothetical protein